jgi:hypothetical protein
LRQLRLLHPFHQTGVFAPRCFSCTSGGVVVYAGMIRSLGFVQQPVSASLLGSSNRGRLRKSPCRVSICVKGCFIFRARYSGRHTRLYVMLFVGRPSSAERTPCIQQALLTRHQATTPHLVRCSDFSVHSNCADSVCLSAFVPRRLRLVVTLKYASCLSGWLRYVRLKCGTLITHSRVARF